MHLERGLLALGMYLMKLRTGESNLRLAHQFHMSERTKCQKNNEKSKRLSPK